MPVYPVDKISALSIGFEEGYGHFLEIADSKRPPNTYRFLLTEGQLADLEDDARFARTGIGGEEEDPFTVEEVRRIDATRTPGAWVPVPEGADE